jgi:leader peptidase (prepilin peptidase) / N-methyltransferase
LTNRSRYSRSGRRRLRRLNWPYCGAWTLLIVILAAFTAWRSMTANLRYDGSQIDWQLTLVASCMETVFLAWFLATGAAIGSFVNVVAYRWPNGLSILGSSHCPYCTHDLSASENIPVFGWLRLRGRCKSCRLPISSRYLAVELWMLIVFGCLFFSVFLPAISPIIAPPNTASISLERKLFENGLASLVLLNFWMLAGLVTVALITIQRSRVPFKLWFWILLPSFLIPLVQPKVSHVSWNKAAWIKWLPESMMSSLSPRWDVLIAVVLGIIAGALLGIAVDLLTRWLRSLLELPPLQISGDAESDSIQGDASPRFNLRLVGIFCIAGALVGWQAMLAVASLDLLLTLCATLYLALKTPMQSSRDQQPSPGSNSSLSLREFENPVVWVWLAVLL